VQPIATDVHVAWSVCLSLCVCVGHTGELCKTSEPIEMPFGAQTHVGPRNLALDKGPDPPTERSTCEGTCQSIVTYLRMNIFCIIRVPPLANVSASARTDERIRRREG